MMKHRVGVYGLLLVCVFGILAFGARAIAAIAHTPMLTYISHYYDSPFMGRVGTVLTTLDLSTGQHFELLDSHENIYRQIWSPDGRFLALTWQEERAITFVAVLDLHGNVITRLNPDSGDAHTPNWLPDSEHIVFAFHEGIDSVIYSANIHTPADWQVVLNLPDFSISNIALSPNGQRMILAGGRNGNEVYLINMADPQLNILSDYSVDFSWSPDGRRTVFSRNDETTRNGDLFIMNLESRVQQRLTENISREFQPVWSPDGTQIAFVSDRDGDYEIYIMNANGTNVRQITFNDVNDTNPAWVP